MHVFVDCVRYDQATGVGQAFQSRSDVDAIAKNVVLLAQDIAQVYAHPERHLDIVRKRPVPFHQSQLHRDRALHSFDCAWKYDD